MANYKTSEEANAVVIVGTELARVVQEGINAKTTTQRIADLARVIAEEIPGPVTLTIVAGALNIDLSLYPYSPFVFDVLVNQNFTISFSNGIDGQIIRARIQQDDNGNRTWNPDATVRFSDDLPEFVLSTEPDTVDYIGFSWCEADGTADIIARNRGAAIAIVAVVDACDLTWNPVDFTVNNALSDYNLLLTGQGCCRALTGKNSGKYYVEFYLRNGMGSSGGQHGIMPGEQFASMGTAAMSPGEYAGASNAANAGYAAVHYFSGGTRVAGLTVDLASYPSISAALTNRMMAVDFDTGKIWFGSNGAWHQGDPATGTSPVGTGVNDGKFYYIVAKSNSGQPVTLRAKSSSWLYSAPAGFGEWPGHTQAEWEPGDAGSSIVLSDLFLTATGSAGSVGIRSTVSRSSGKRYVELRCNLRGTGTNQPMWGISLSTTALGTMIGNSDAAYGLYPQASPFTAAVLQHSASAIQTFASGTAIQVGDVSMMAIDFDAGKLWFGKNGTWFSGDPAAGTGAHASSVPIANYYLQCLVDSTSSVTLLAAPDDWIYPAPTGFEEWGVCPDAEEFPPEGAINRILLHFDGGEGVTSVVDSIVNGISWSTGPAAAQDDARIWSGASSMVFPTGTGKLSGTITASSAMDFTRWSGGWCLEFYAWPNALSGSIQNMVSFWEGPSNYNFQIICTSTVVALNCNAASGPSVTNAASGFAVNRWNRIRARRVGTTWSLWVNQVKAADVVQTNVLMSGSHAFMFGMNVDGGGNNQQFSNGNIDEFYMWELLP